MHSHGIGPLSKWVDDHIFFRILCTHLESYNLQWKRWALDVAENGGEVHDGSRLWFRGATMPNDWLEEFDEDLSFPICDLALASKRFVSLPAPAPSPLPPVPIAHPFIDPMETVSSHIPWQTSTLCPTNWASLGKQARTSPSATWALSSTSPGISPTAQSAYHRARGRNTFKPSRSGNRSRNTSWAKYRSSMGSYFMPATSFLLEEPTSPTWRPSWGYVMIVLSACIAHPAELRAIFSGGRISSPSQPSSSPSPVPPPSSIQTLTQMLAQKLASGSRLGIDGEHGDFYWAGKPIARTFDGQRQSASSSSYSPLPPLHQETPTSRSSATTEEWSKVGGKAGAATDPPTMFSGTSMTSLKRKASSSTRDMFPAKKTQQMAHPEGSTTMAPSSSQLSPYPHRSDNTYATSTCLSHQLSCTLYSRGKPQHLSQGPTVPHSNENVPKSMPSLNDMPGPPSPRRKNGSTGERFTHTVQFAPKAGKPTCYAKDLCPLPSTRRPHVLASKRLQLWTPLHGHKTTRNMLTNLSPEDIRQISVVIGKAWEESTLAAYSSGLLNFHVYCDQKNIPEDQHMPASPLLISTFMSSLTGAYSSSTIDNYVYGIRAWHILHGVRWQMDTAELEALLRAAEKMAPPTSKKKKRVPYTIEFMLAVRSQLQLDKPRNATVYSCLTTAFYAAACLGEFTVPNLGAFNGLVHVKPSDVRIELDRNGLCSTVF